MENMTGIFCTRMPIEEVVIESVKLAEDLCMINYGCIPPIEISCTPNSYDDIKLLYIPRSICF